MRVLAFWDKSFTLGCDDGFEVFCEGFVGFLPLALAEPLDVGFEEFIVFPRVYGDPLRAGALPYPVTDSVHCSGGDVAREALGHLFGDLLVECETEDGLDWKGVGNHDEGGGLRRSREGVD